MAKFTGLFRNALDQVERFRRHEGGTMALFVGLASIPIIFAVGAGVDYSTANMTKTKLQAVADAAALAAVDHSQITDTATNAQTVATNVFNSEAVNLHNVTVNSLTVNVTDSNTGRTAVVSYTATKTNTFMGVMGIQTTNISGTATAQAGLSVNINFYLLLDNSPSMNIAATSAGIQTMVNHTSAQGGCAFACHETNPSADNLGNPNGEDNYTLAQNLNVVTRMQNLASATQSLMTTAQATEGSNTSQYQMAIYTFANNGINTIQALTSDLTAAKTAAGTINVLQVYKNNWLTSTNNNSDMDTNFETAMTQISSVMPNPGLGTPTSTPQEVLFIVSDGVDDEANTHCSQPLSGSNRCQQPFDTTMCTTIKNRGIQIAVLYTEYLPLTTNSWYTSWIQPFQSQIASNMESCASTGMFFQVTTDGDITAALRTLFAQAIATARLTN
jgi:Flp pilus assembly protein TadG